MANKGNYIQVKIFQICLTHNEKTLEMEQNLEKWGCDYFQGILVP